MGPLIFNLQCTDKHASQVFERTLSLKSVLNSVQISENDLLVQLDMTVTHISLHFY